MFHIKTFWLKTSILTLLACLMGYLVLHFHQTRGWQAARGTYLVGGGETCVVIDGAHGWLSAQGGLHTFGWRNQELCKEKISPRMSNGVLLIQQSCFYKGLPMCSWVYDKINSKVNIRLRPSTAHPGDWDIRSANATVTEQRVPPLKECFSHAFFRPKDYFEIDNWKKALVEEYFGYSNEWNSDASYVLGSPVQPSYLHRVDDAALPSYFQKRGQGKTDGEVLEMIRAIQARHPNDIYIALHRAEMEAVHGDVQNADKLWAQWLDQKNKVADPFLRITARRVENRIYTARLQQGHPTFSLEIPALSLLTGKENTPPHYTSPFDWDTWLTDLGNLNLPIFFPRSLVPNSEEERVCESIYIPSYWVQKRVQENALLSLQGKTTNILPILKGYFSYALAYMDRFPDNYHIAPAIAELLRAGLEPYLLHFCNTPEQATAFFKSLDALTKSYRTLIPESDIGLPERLDSPFFQVLGLDAQLWDPHHGTGGGKELKCTALSKMQELRVLIDLFKAGAVARHRLLSAGDLPITAAEFGPLFPNGLSADPFRTTCTLQLRRTTDTLTLYSVGANGSDNKGEKEENIFHDKKKKDDIALIIPRKIESQPAIHAKNAADLLRQFPNGLPQDFFAHPVGPAPGGKTTPIPLSIMDATTTMPLRVFSVGIIGLHSWEEYINRSLEPSLLPPASAPEMRKNQRIFIWGEKPEGVASWSIKTWEPPGTLEWYDPTNGTNSAGCFYIDIPKP
ncbi:TPA: hypothetical protein DDW35_05180 [Candidatus Sumerlaeota bacterium]|nr:hypothetical protein [Candidatus Sumerlaeota bacterium]